MMTAGGRGFMVVRERRGWRGYQEQREENENVL
jgi:hypothetical protein